MDKSTISMAIFNSFLYVYQRVEQVGFWDLSRRLEMVGFRTGFDYTIQWRWHTFKIGYSNTESEL